MSLNISSKIQTNSNYPPLQKKTTQFSILEVIFLFFVLALFYWFVVMPKANLLKSALSQLEIKKEEQNKAENNLKNIQESIRVLGAHQKDIIKLDEALPLDSRNTKLYILIDSLAQSSGVTIGDINIVDTGEIIYADNKELIKDPFKAKRSLKKFTGNIHVLGSYEQLQGFLNQMEESGRIINVNSIEIGREQEGVLSLRAIIEAYSYE